ncbi:MAG TPA: EAL domain-containing protein, partial [Noviherbaspirillum sp.]|nr:EAL domain-containing protein [Noviherbaspirillum sp.]
ELAKRRALAQKNGFRGLACLPLRDKDRTFGLLTMYSSEAGSTSEEEVELLQNLADNLAFGIDSIRSRNERQRLESVVLKVAAGVSASSGTRFFTQLVNSMAEALGAQAGFVARFVPEDLSRARTISAVVDGEVVDNFEYVVADTPCKHFMHDDYCIVHERAATLFPRSPALAVSGAQAYVGRRLDNSAGNPIGFLYVLFREPLKRIEFVTSTLQIFAARAASELERQDADARIRDQASLLDKAQDAIIVCGIDHRIEFWNKGAERLSGWTAEEVLGRSKLEFLCDDPVSCIAATERVLREGEWSGEMIYRRKNGTTLPVESHWTLVCDDSGKPQSVFTINTDITRRKAADREIQYLAFYDPLTGLPNRRLLLDRLQQAVAGSGRSSQSGALLFIDLDNFKALNDTVGHDKGDLLLQQVALRLSSSVRKSNTVARLGGDEFVVMLEDLNPVVTEAAAQARIVAEKILTAFQQPFALGGYAHHSSPSIGVALFGGESSSVDELLKRADLAMYQAKAAGRNTVRFFDPDMQKTISARVALEADIRKGMTRSEFVLHYQVQVDRHGHMTGAEALLRWRHPRRGIVSPTEFISLAEDTGLILPLGQWVLETACMQLASWATYPETSGLTLSVNVSVRQFRHPEFVPRLLVVLERSGADPHKLKLELTESMLIDNLSDTIAKMGELKARGVGFSLDDFGTGYSSLSYLKRLPLDQIKIDQSFVNDVLTDPNDAAIARTIVALGHSLGLIVIAEGVETEQQRDFLAQYGCDAYQGFLYSLPLPAEQFLAFMRNR